ncbi:MULTISPECIES: MBL fold metallo-hydrolase [Aphanothece]|uniref:MBL fold metallo-hydrolase n=1 Tax=Aphanothece TaxID=1121 RepID=UPI0039853889
MAPETRRIGIIDAGTGIRKLGADFTAMGTDQKEIFIAFTHFHWDHIQGFPFFGPAYDPTTTIKILAKGGKRRAHTLKDIFATQMQETYFPVSMRDMGANFDFILLDSSSHTFIPPDGIPVTIKAIKHRHPGDAYSYRYERAGRSIVFSTDIEHGDAIDENIVTFAQGADILIHDGQYSNEELATKRGWGHSSFEQAAEVAIRANVRQLVVTHHDPDHDDDYLENAEKLCQDIFPDALFAREGMVLST